MTTYYTLIGPQGKILAWAINTIGNLEDIQGLYPGSYIIEEPPEKDRTMYWDGTQYAPRPSIAISCNKFTVSADGEDEIVCTGLFENGNYEIYRKDDPENPITGALSDNELRIAVVIPGEYRVTIKPQFPIQEFFFTFRAE